MLAVRRRCRAFGRGTLRFLYPGNRKVLAYLRETRRGHEETVLCVCNLSRTAQAVELDLAAFNGRVPVDMLGGSVFPPIGQLTYLLTLPPYGFFWFAAGRPRRSCRPGTSPAPEPLPEFATIVVRRAIEEVLAPPAAPSSSARRCRPICAMRRWFAAKDAAPVRRAHRLRRCRSRARRDVLLSEIAVQRRRTRRDYVLPLGIAWEDETTGAAGAAACARAHPPRPSRRRADRRLRDRRLRRRVVRRCCGAARVDRRWTAGEAPLPADGPAGRAWRLPPGAEIRRLSAEQSNSSLILGDAVVLKIDPPRRRRHPSGRRDDPRPDRARLRQHRAAAGRSGARSTPTARRTR